MKKNLPLNPVLNYLRLITFQLCLISLLSSCVDPPPAPPEEMEALLGFLFEHMADEDPTPLVEGIQALKEWYKDEDHLQSGQEGFVVNNLPQTALDSLGGQTRSTQNLKGMSVVTKSGYCPQHLAGLLTWDLFGDLLDNFEVYERSFTEDSSCFWSKDCEQTRADSRTVSKWANIIRMETKYAIEFRWIYTPDGWAFLHRFWLKEPAIGDSFGVRMNANYYIGITLIDGERSLPPLPSQFIETANGFFAGSGDALAADSNDYQSTGSLRVHGNWFQVDTGTIPLGEDQILNTLLQNQRNDSEKHDLFLDMNPEIPGECSVN